MSPTATARTDETAVRGVLDQLYRAWADGDADAFAAPYREDATVTMPGVYHRGRDTIRDFMAAGFAGPLQGSRGVDEPLEVRIIGDTAIVISKAGIIMAGTNEVPADRERVATWVLARNGGNWQIAAYSNTPAH
ncbi:MAG TPA: SgcJ/EcaC family oxidoreductase [Mycobacteriales bacterium]|nr:SgcJ/EcaC family oxidoreductase [Mycobacteriales bacterium]